MITSTAIEKAFDKTQHLFMIKKKKKKLTANYREENFLHLKRSIYKKPTASAILSGEKLRAFPLRSATGRGCLFMPFPLNTHPDGSPR